MFLKMFGFCNPFLLWIALLFGLPGVQVTAAEVGPSLLIRQITLVSPEKEEHQPDMDVLVSEGRIVRIGKQLKQEGASVIDGRGKYLTPGLIDSHVHLGSDGGVRDSQTLEGQALVELFRAQEPRSYLYFGFTTLVDMKQSEAFARNWQQLEVRPDLLYCKAIPFTNGYGMAFQPDETRFLTPYFIYDTAQKEKIPNDIDPAAHTPEAVIAKVRKTGASCIKTYHESGFGGLWDWPVPGNDVIKRLNELAGEAGLLHMHHGNSLKSYEQAAVSGVDVVAHGLWHWGEENGQKHMPPRVKAVLNKVVEQGTAIQATARVVAGELDVHDKTYLSLGPLSHSLPPRLLEWHKAGNSDWFRQRMTRMVQDNPDVVRRFLGQEPTGTIGETSLAALDRLKRVVGYLKELGATFLLASDTPSSPTYTNPPGLNSTMEIALLHQMGLTLSDVFNAATINNARVLGIDQEVGTIEVGKKANLLILSLNPRETIEAYTRIETVIVGGRAMARGELSAMSMNE